MASIQELKDAVDAEFSQRLLGGNPVLSQSNFDIISGYIAALQFSQEQALNEVNARLTPSTATGDLLDSWGASFNVARLQASFATGSVTITGTSGTTLPTGTALTRCDGVQYTTTADVTIAGGTASVAVTASDTGSDANFLSGGALEMGSVTAGIASTAISQGIVGGSGVECDDNFRSRILATIRNPCRTGTADDYEYWAMLYPGVTRVCVVPLGNGPGTVKVYFLMDDTYTDGIPAPADVNALQSAIFGAGGLAPLGIVGEVCAPAPYPVDVDISGVGPLSAAEFTAIEDALAAAFLDFFDCNASTVCRADLEIALRNILDGCFSLDTPAANVAIPSGSVPVLGNLIIV